MGLATWRFLALVVTALSFGASLAHLLEAVPRLTVWSPELWREATVFNGQYRVFGILGGPLDGGAVIVTAILAFRTRAERPGFWPALAGAILFAASLVVWLGIVAPVNGILAEWRPGPVPADFFELRNRWEFGHVVIATIKLVGFMAVALSVVLAKIPTGAWTERPHST